MGRGLFVVGTDTGVGKTVVAAGLVLVLRARGLSVGAHKPVASGCSIRNGRLACEDAEMLAAASGQRADAVCPLMLEEPLAPEVAAERAGVSITREQLLGNLREAQAGCEALVVEGVGGLMVPLCPGTMVIDLLAESGLPAVLVSRLGLGTINHTLLSLDGLARRGIHVAGVIMNSPSPPEGTVAEGTNPAVIAGLTSVPIWGVLPHVGDPWGLRRDLSPLADAFAANVDVPTGAAEPRHAGPSVAG